VGSKTLLICSYPREDPSHKKRLRGTDATTGAQTESAEKQGMSESVIVKGGRPLSRRVHVGVQGAKRKKNMNSLLID